MANLQGDKAGMAASMAALTALGYKKNTSLLSSTDNREQEIKQRGWDNTKHANSLLKFEDELKTSKNQRETALGNLNINREQLKLQKEESQQRRILALGNTISEDRDRLAKLTLDNIDSNEARTSISAAMSKVPEKQRESVGTVVEGLRAVKGMTTAGILAGINSFQDTWSFDSTDIENAHKKGLAWLESPESSTARASNIVTLNAAIKRNQTRYDELSGIRPTQEQAKDQLGKTKETPESINAANLVTGGNKPSTPTAAAATEATPQQQTSTPTNAKEVADRNAQIAEGVTIIRALSTPEKGNGWISEKQRTELAAIDKLVATQVFQLKSKAIKELSPIVQARLDTKLRTPEIVKEVKKSLNSAVDTVGAKFEEASRIQPTNLISLAGIQRAADGAVGGSTEFIDGINRVSNGQGYSPTGKVQQQLDLDNAATIGRFDKRIAAAKKEGGNSSVPGTVKLLPNEVFPHSTAKDLPNSPAGVAPKIGKTTAVSIGASGNLTPTTFSKDEEKGLNWTEPKKMVSAGPNKLSPTGSQFTTVMTMKTATVSDGDSIYFKNNEGKSALECRIENYDSPETRHGDKQGQEYGEYAKATLKNLIMDKKVTVTVTAAADPKGKGKNHGRALCKVEISGEAPLHHQMLSEGAAWLFEEMGVPAIEELAIMKKARSDKKGLWAGERPIHPSDFRQMLKIAGGGG